MGRKKEDFREISSKLILPYLETDMESIVEIFRVLEREFGLIRGSKQKLVDLGSGDGRIVIHAAMNYEIEAHGVELDKYYCQQSKKMVKKLKKENKSKKKTLKKARFKRGDLFEFNLKNYDFVYVYSYPPMQKYLKHVLKTAKKGAVIISHGYELLPFSEFLLLEKMITCRKGKGEISTSFYIRRE
ncbi:MAG: class I SAM-dependent methyltransferase [Promethearchaeota archaeon]